MLYNLTPEQMINLMNDPQFVLIFTLVAIWSLIWKGIALWKASRRGQKVWFVVLLVLNTIGIVEILYIFWLNKCCTGKKNDQLPSNSQQ